MAEKPSYDELEQRLSELEKEASEARQAEEGAKRTEQDMRAILDSLLEHVVYQDADMNVLWANQAACNSVGKTREDLIGRRCYEVWAGRDSACEDCPVAKACDTGKPETVEKMTPDGRWWHIQGYLVRDDGGHIVGTVELTLDITERKRAEEALRESEANYRLLFSAESDAIVVVDAETKQIVDANQAALALYGYEREEFVGLRAIELSAEPEKSAAHIEKVASGTPEVVSPGPVERVHKKKDGTTFSVEISSGAYALNGRKMICAIMRDITERKQAQKSLKESQERYRQLWDEAPVAYHRLDTNGIILQANQTEMNMLGYSPDEMVGTPIFEYVLPQQRKEAERRFRLKLAGKHVSKQDDRIYVRKDGSKIHVSIDDRLERDADGKVIGVRTTMVDVSERKRAEDALQEAHDTLERRVEERTADLIATTERLRNEIEERRRTQEALQDSEEALKAILAASPVGIGLAQDRIIQWGNRALYNMLGYEEDALEGINAKMIYADSVEYERVGRDLYPIVEDKGIGHVETKWVAKDGAVLDCYVQLTALDRSDLSKGVIVAAMDITQRKQTEDQIRTLSHQLLQAQEVERQRLAYDLHDHLAQDLSALKIAFDTLSDRHPEISTGARQKMAELSKGLYEVIFAVRHLAYDLRPPGLDEAGLVDVLDEYCQEYSSQNNLEIEFLPVGVDESKLDFDTKITLYRLIQEALSNVRKHANASHVSIRLVSSFPNIILRVEDDGRGFDVTARLAALHYEKRMGLLGIKERVALLGGTMELQSRPEKGTKIFIELPYGAKYHDKEEDHAHR